MSFGVIFNSIESRNNPALISIKKYLSSETVHIDIDVVSPLNQHHPPKSN